MSKSKLLKKKGQQGHFPCHFQKIIVNFKLGGIIMLSTSLNNRLKSLPESEGKKVFLKILSGSKAPVLRLKKEAIALEKTILSEYKKENK